MASNIYNGAHGGTLTDALNNPDKMYIDKIGAYHMIGDDDYEPQHKNNFELHVYNMENLFKVDSGTKIKPDVAKKMFALDAVNVTGIKYSTDPIKIRHGNTEVRYAGLTTIGPDFSVSYNDFIGKDTEQIIMAWYGLVLNPKTQKGGRASQYKKPAVLVETAPDGTHSRIIDIQGIWPSSVELGGFDYNDGNVRQIAVTFTFDKAVPRDTW